MNKPLQWCPTSSQGEPWVAPELCFLIRCLQLGWLCQVTWGVLNCVMRKQLSRVVCCACHALPVPSDCAAGVPMVAINWQEMQCPQTKVLERRKVAKVT